MIIMSLSNWSEHKTKSFLKSKFSTEMTFMTFVHFVFPVCGILAGTQ